MKHLLNMAVLALLCGCACGGGDNCGARVYDSSKADIPAWLVKNGANADESKADCYAKLDILKAPDGRKIETYGDWLSLRPEVERWYSEFCRRFPTKGWKPPKKIKIRYKEGIKVPAYATKPGNVITLNRRRFNKTKSVGCVMHELFHIVQQYRKTPKWITEAMADYARNYVWTTKGCPMNTRNRRARSKYATGANFIAFVESRHPGTAVKLNDVCRRGKYKEDAFWPDATGKTLDELEKEWQASSPPPKPKKKRVVVRGKRK